MHRDAKATLVDSRTGRINIKLKLSQQQSEEVTHLHDGETMSKTLPRTVQERHKAVRVLRLGVKESLRLELVCVRVQLLSPA